MKLKIFQNNICYCFSVDLGCLSEIEGKLLLLKTLHTFNTELKLDLIRKVPESNWKASFLHSSSFIMRKCYASCQGMEALNSSIQL